MSASSALPRRRSLERRLVALSVTAAVAPLAAFGVFSTRESLDVLRRKTGDEIVRAAGRYALDLDRTLGELRTSLVGLASQDAVRGAVPDDLDGVVTNLAAGLCRSDSRLASIDCVDSAGHVTASSAAGRIGTRVVAPWLQDAFGRRAGEVGLADVEGGGDEVLVLTAPVPRLGSDAVGAVLAFRLRASILAAPTEAAGRAVLVFDRRGALAYTSASPERTRALEPVARSLCSQAQDGARTEGDQLGAASPLAASRPWQAVVLEPLEIAFASAYALARTAVAFAAATLVLTVVVALGVARRIARPLRALTDVAESIASAGDLGRTVAVGSADDEVGRLAAAFNAMIGSLRRERDALTGSNWLITGQAGLNEASRGEHSPRELASAVLRFLARYLDAHAGLFYASKDGQRFELLGRHSVPLESPAVPRFAVGEGLLGEAVRERRARVIEADAGVRIDCGLGVASPRHVLVAPLVHGNGVAAVLVLGFLRSLETREREFLERCGETICVYLRSVESHAETRALLEETKRQAEELTAQNLAIAEQRRALDKANAELQTASKHKSDFLASMSHELRTPLNAIIGFTSLTLSALRGTLPPEHQKNLGNIDRAARTLLALINDVLDFAKIEAGRVELLVEPVDLREVVDDVLAIGEGALEQRRGSVELRSELPEGATTVETDFTRLKQVLTNLVSNAVKFTEQGHVLVRVRVRSAADPVLIEVEDTGIGIAAEKARDLFQAFKQVDGSIQKKYGGTGLGLAISKSFCDLLAVRIDLESRPGSGTKFTLEVPRIFRGQRPAAPAPEPAPPAPAPAAGLAPAQPGPGEPAPAAAPVVVHLGEPRFAGELGEQLGPLGLETVRVDRPEELAKVLETRLAWSVVVDAETTSPELLASLGALVRKGGEALPVVLCGRATGISDRFPVGSLRFLPKPLEPAALLDTFLGLARERTRPILVVDDDPLVRELYAKVLEGGGFAVRTAANGREALVHLREKGASGVLLDLLMPELDGFAVLEAMRRDPALARVPVIVATGKDLTPEEQRAVASGARLLLPKQALRPEDFARTVASIVPLVEQGPIRTVLVVDDNEMNRQLLVQILEDAGYTVAAAASGLEAVERAERDRPDAILMDLAMPGMDGLEATRRIKAGPASRAIVIACTAFSTSEWKSRAHDVGCEGYISKPIDPTRLVEQLKRFVLAARVRRWHEAAKKGPRG